MASKLIKKLKKKKGKLARPLDTSREIDISRNVINVYLAEDFYKKNGLNGKDKKNKKDKDKKYKSRTEKKRLKLIEKVNKMRDKNKRISKIILKLKMRRTKYR